LLWNEVDEAEVDEMWGFVGSKANQGWLWYAICHQTRNILAYVFGERKDEVFRGCGLEMITNLFGRYFRHSSSCFLALPKGNVCENTP